MKTHEAKKTSPVHLVLYEGIKGPAMIPRELFNEPFLMLLHTESFAVQMAIADVVQEHEGA